MTRIANLAASNQLLSHLSRTQQRVNEGQVQVATEKVSQDYAGIAPESGRLLRLENARDTLQRFIGNNETMETRLKAANTALEAMQKSVRDFRGVLLDSNGKPIDQDRVADVQAAAFRALKDMEAYLNTDVDGQFLFASGRVTTRSVDLGLTTLADFQAQYDGAAVTYPETREAQLAQFSLSADSSGADEWLMFEGDPDGVESRITATTAEFANIAPGTRITVSGAGANNGVYTVQAVGDDGKTITVAGKTLVDQGDAGTKVAGTIAATSYYNGDEVALTHRVDSERSFGVDLTAVDPAIEKAIRAMGIIAQGRYGTDGGLDQHPDRIQDAAALLNNALERASTTSPPFGDERDGNFEDALMEIGFQRALIDQSTQRHEELIGSLETRIAGIENIDKAEAITRLLKTPTRSKPLTKRSPASAS